MPILLFILFIFFFVFIIIFFVLSFLFSIFRPRNFRSARKRKQQDSPFSTAQQQNSRKIFEKSEGEYIDFEEVKTP